MMGKKVKLVAILCIIVLIVILLLEVAKLLPFSTYIGTVFADDFNFSPGGWLDETKWNVTGDKYPTLDIKLGGFLYFSSREGASNVETVDVLDFQNTETTVTINKISFPLLDIYGYANFAVGILDYEISVRADPVLGYSYRVYRWEKLSGGIVPTKLLETKVDYYKMFSEPKDIVVTFIDDVLTFRFDTITCSETLHTSTTKSKLRLSFEVTKADSNYPAYTVEIDKVQVMQVKELPPKKGRPSGNIILNSDFDTNNYWYRRCVLGAFMSPVQIDTNHGYTTSSCAVLDDVATVGISAHCPVHNRSVNMMLYSGSFKDCPNGTYRISFRYSPPSLTNITLYIVSSGSSGFDIDPLIAFTKVYDNVWKCFIISYGEILYELYSPKFISDDYIGYAYREAVFEVTMLNPCPILDENVYVFYSIGISVPITQEFEQFKREFYIDDVYVYKVSDITYPTISGTIEEKGNLIRNPGFECGTRKWRYFDNYIGIFPEKSVVYSGKYSVAGYGYLMQLFNVPATGTYYCSMIYKFGSIERSRLVEFEIFQGDKCIGYFCASGTGFNLSTDFKNSAIKNLGNGWFEFKANINLSPGDYVLLVGLYDAYGDNIYIGNENIQYPPPEPQGTIPEIPGKTTPSPSYIPMPEQVLQVPFEMIMSIAIVATAIIVLIIVLVKKRNRSW